MCVCVRRISLGGEGNVLYPVLSSYVMLLCMRVCVCACVCPAVILSVSVCEIISCEQNTSKYYERILIFLVKRGRVTQEKSVTFR